MDATVTEKRAAIPVPYLCEGGTAVCIASGPSLLAADVEYVRDKASAVIAVNDCWRLAPWADALIANDAAWWHYYKGVPAFDGLRYGLEEGAKRWGVAVLKISGHAGLETKDRTAIRSGRHSGAAAVNLAVLFGAKRIVLLGYDCQARDEAHSHWFGQHPRGLHKMSPYGMFRATMEALARPLDKLGIEVVNCSRSTAIRTFRRASIEEVF